MAIQMVNNFSNKVFIKSSYLSFAFDQCCTPIIYQTSFSLSLIFLVSNSPQLTGQKADHFQILTQLLCLYYTVTTSLTIKYFYSFMYLNEFIQYVVSSPLN
jgi:hypothetical protein